MPESSNKRKRESNSMCRILDRQIETQGQRQRGEGYREKEREAEGDKENASSFKIFRVSRGQMENRKSEREIEQGRNRFRVLQK